MTRSGPPPTRTASCCPFCRAPMPPPPTWVVGTVANWSAKRASPDARAPWLMNPSHRERVGPTAELWEGEGVSRLPRNPSPCRVWRRARPLSLGEVSARTMRCRRRGVSDDIGIEIQQRPRYPVGPAKPVLERIFAAAARSGGLDVVLFHQLAGLRIGSADVGQPTDADPPRQPMLAIGAEAPDGDPLQRRPAVGRVPLLTGRPRRGPQAPGLEEIARHRHGHAPRLVAALPAHQQRLGHPPAPATPPP